jgi:hypothetical protein
VQAALAGEPGIAGFTLAPGRADAGAGAGADADADADADGRQGGTDLAITLRLTPQDAKHDPQTANRAAASIAARLAGRLRRGIEVTLTG